MMCRLCGWFVMNLAILLGLLGYRASLVPTQPSAPGKEYVAKLQEFRKMTAEKVDWAIQKHSFLVIGGTGFTGGNLVDDLLARNAKLVRVLSRKAPKKPKAGVEYISGSITDLDSMLEAVNGISIVFHTAAFYGSPSFGRTGSSERVFSINEGGMKKVVQACKEKNVALLIFTSSVDTVFTGFNYVDISEETTPYAEKSERAGCHYTHSKIAAEKHCLSSDSSDGLRTMSLRPNGIIGPGENWFIPKAIAPGFIMGCAWFYLSMEQFTDFTSVYNLVWAHMLAVAQFEKDSNAIGGKAYFITDGEHINSAGFKVFAPMIEATGAKYLPLVPFGLSMMPKFGWFSEMLHLKIPSIAPFLTEHEAWKGVTTHTHSIARAKADFGYEPLFNTTEGLPYIAEEMGRRFRGQE